MSGNALNVTIIEMDMDTVTRFQILAEAMGILHSYNYR